MYSSSTSLYPPQAGFANWFCATSLPKRKIHAFVGCERLGCLWTKSRSRKKFRTHSIEIEKTMDGTLPPDNSRNDYRTFLCEVKRFSWKFHSRPTCQRGLVNGPSRLFCLFSNHLSQRQTCSDVNFVWRASRTASKKVMSLCPATIITNDRPMESV